MPENFGQQEELSNGPTILEGAHSEGEAQHVVLNTARHLFINSTKVTKLKQPHNI